MMSASNEPPGILALCPVCGDDYNQNQPHYCQEVTALAIELAKYKALYHHESCCGKTVRESNRKLQAKVADAKSAMKIQSENGWTAMSEKMQDRELWVIFMHSAMTMSTPQEASEYADKALMYYKERWASDTEEDGEREKYDEKAAFNDN